MSQLFGRNGTLSPTKLFGEDGTISNAKPRILGADGKPYRQDAPDYGFQIGHPITFSSILSSGYRSYWHGNFDTAMRHGREDALAMRNDAFLMSLLQERKLATASLRWHIEVDDERDPLEVGVRDTLTRILREIPRFRQLLYYMLEAIWYGRYGSEIVWKWAYGKMPSLKDPTQNEEIRYLAVDTHQPINGDKIGHHWDGTPYILVNPAFDRAKWKSVELHPTTAGADGLYLRGHWRKHFIIHRHEVLDGDYFDPMGADAVHGIGIRSVLFWLDWIRKEWLGNIADWCERTGLGIRLWYFQAGNPRSEAAVKQAAKDSNDRTNIFIPRYGANGAGNEGVEYVDTSGTGADLLLRLQTHLEEHEERFVVGQSMSSGRDANDGLGGSGRAKFAKDTKNLLVAYDAANLGETVSTDLIAPIKEWTYRDNAAAKKVNTRFILSVDEEEPEKLMTAVKTFVGELGGTVREDGVRTALGKGFEKPQPGDAIISMETINKQKQAGMPQQAPGMPGGAPGEGGGDPMQQLMAQMGGGQEEAPGASEPGQEDVLQASPQQEPKGEPGSDEVQKTVDDKLNQMLARMERIETWVGEPIRYQRDQQLRNEITHAESQTNTEPTDKEKESGNYRKGKVNLHGLSIAIETPKGVERSGIGDDGKPWSIKMKNSYGYILGTNSKADSDHVDVFIGPVPESEIVFVIDQNKKDGTFDEHKAVVGTVSASDARALYLSNYEDGWDRLGGIKAMTMDAFKEWVTGHRTDSRAADQQITH